MMSNAPRVIVRDGEMGYALSLANSPAIKKRIEFDCSPDVIEAKPDWRVYEVIADCVRIGCFLTEDVADDAVVIHSLFEKGGKDAVYGGRRVLDYIFETRENINRIIGLCPSDIPEVLAFARLCGMDRYEYGDQKLTRKNGTIAMGKCVFTTRQSRLNK